MPEGRNLIAGTEHVLHPGEHIVGAAQPDQLVTVSIYLRRAPGAEVPSAEDLLSGTAQSMGREAAENALRASPQDMQAVLNFLESEHLEVVEQDPASRRIVARGTVSQMDAAFGVHLENAAIGTGHPYLTYGGAITVPSPLAGIVTAVLGLDNRPIATHH